MQMFRKYVTEIKLRKKKLWVDFKMQFEQNIAGMLNFSFFFFFSPFVIFFFFLSLTFLISSMPHQYCKRDQQYNPTSFFFFFLPMVLADRFEKKKIPVVEKSGLFSQDGGKL